MRPLRSRPLPLPLSPSLSLLLSLARPSLMARPGLSGLREEEEEEEREAERFLGGERCLALSRLRVRELRGEADLDAAEAWGRAATGGLEERARAFLEEGAEAALPPPPCASVREEGKGRLRGA